MEGFRFFFIKKRELSDNDIYVAEIYAISSIENPLSINIPKKAVPNAVENTIRAVVSALIDPIYLTP